MSPSIDSSDDSSNSSAPPSPVLWDPVEEKVIPPPVVWNPTEFWDVTDQLLPKALRDFRHLGWSRNAAMYGFSNRKYMDNNGDDLSSWTPLSSPTAVPQRVSVEHQLNIQWQQKYYFHGFDARELGGLGALAFNCESPYNNLKYRAGVAMGKEIKGYSQPLNNPIHPIFAKDRWKTKAMYWKHQSPAAIRGETKGEWLAENPVVWRALAPCLQLCSLFLTNDNVLAWWHTLFFGSLKEIDKKRLHSKIRNTDLDDLFSIHKTADKMGEPQKKAVKEKLLKAAKKIRWSLFCGYTDTFTGVVEEVNGQLYGSTQKGFYPRDELDEMASVFLTIELLQPLITGALTEGERALTQYRVMETVLHELCHALWYIREEEEDLDTVGDEPFFEDEPMSELGMSMQHHIFGGYAISISAYDFERYGPATPKIGLWKTDRFVSWHKDYNDTPCLDQYESGQFEPDPDLAFNNVDRYPVPAIYYLDIMKNDKWRAVGVFGADALKMGPVTVGTRDPTSRPGIGNGDYVFRNAPLDAPIAENLIQIQGLIPPRKAAVSKAEKQVLDLESARCTKAIELRTKIGQPAPRSVDPPKNYPQIRNLGLTQRYPKEWTRFYEIRDYLASNSKPTQLAIDTMDFEIPETTLYKYIQNHGGIVLSEEEWRNFLECCREMHCLFDYTRFPGVGMVRKIPYGWNKIRSYKPPQLKRPNPMHLRTFKQYFKEVFKKKDMGHFFYPFCDLDFEFIITYWNTEQAYTRNSPRKRKMRLKRKVYPLPVDQAELIVNQFIIDTKSKYFSHGPKGIARISPFMSRPNPPNPTFLEKHLSPIQLAKHRHDIKADIIFAGRYAALAKIKSEQDALAAANKARLDAAFAAQKAASTQQALGAAEKLKREEEKKLREALGKAKDAGVVDVRRGFSVPSDSEESESGSVIDESSSQDQTSQNQSSQDQGSQDQGLQGGDPMDVDP